MITRYLMRDRDTGVLYKYTRYASGNITRKNLMTVAPAEKITAEELTHAIETNEIIHEYETEV